MTCHHCCNGCSSACSCYERRRSEYCDGATPLGFVLFLVAFAIFALLIGTNEQTNHEATVQPTWEHPAQQ